MKELVEEAEKRVVEARMQGISFLLPPGLPYSSDVRSGLDAIEPSPFAEESISYKRPFLGNLFSRILHLLKSGRGR